MSKACKKPRSRAKPAPSIPPFLHKIYEILENPTYNDLASWNPEGDAFMIKNVTEFTEKVLPEYFKHKNFASFVRQLNLYGFHKSRYENNGSEFHHKFFKRGERHLLTDIKRKGPNEDPSDSSSPFAPAPDEMETERQVQMPFINMNSLQDIIARQERLESAMKIIYTENKHLKRDNKMLWNEVIKVKTKQSNTEKATRAIHEQNTQLLKDNQGLWGELIRTREKHERQVEKLLLFLISIFNYSGANPAGLLQKKNMRGSTFNGTQEEDIQYQYENVPTDNQVLSIMPAKPNKNYNRKTKSHLDTLFERLEKDSKNSFLATIFEEKDFTNKLASLLESEPGKTGMSSLEYLMDKRSAPLDYSFEGDDKTTSKFCNKENQSWDPSAVFIDEEKGAIPHYNFDKPPTMEELTHDIQDVNLHSPMNLEAGSDFDMPPLKNEDNGNFTNIGLFNPFNRGINEDDQDSLCDDEEEKKDPFTEGNTYFEPNYENPQNFLERMDSGRFDDNAPWFSPTNFLRRNSNLSEMGQNRFFNPSRNNSGLDLSM